MPLWLVALKPGLIGLKNIISRPGQRGSGRARFVLVSLLTLVVWLLLFLFTVKILGNLREADIVGDILCRRFLSLLWTAGVLLLLFSSLISSLSSLFLSKDLELLMASPLSLEGIFWARSTQALVVSAWMPIAFMLPIFLAYAVVFEASFLYYLVAPLATIPLLVGAGYLSQMMIFVLVNVFPARRAREMMGLMAVVGFCSLYLAFRLIRPEELINPDGFMSAAAYLASLEGAGTIMLPNEWALEAAWPLLVGRPGPMNPGLWLALLWSTAAALAVITSYVADAIYWSGYNKSLEGSSRRLGGRPGWLSSVFLFLVSFLKPTRRALVVKDLKTFFRDHSQWSQLLLLAALVGFYSYNFSVLNLGRFPKGTFILENLFTFLNMGLVAMIASVLSLRFAYPSISAEGFAYWIIKSSPLTPSEFMNIKFWLWFPPIWLVSMGMAYTGHYFLDLSPVVNVLSLGLMALLIPGMCALAIGLGSAYPRFEAANLAQVSSGYGGLVYMVVSSLASLMVIGLAAWPTVYFLRLERGGSPELGSMLFSVLLLGLGVVVCWALFILPMRRGLKALTLGEYGDS